MVWQLFQDCCNQGRRRSSSYADNHANDFPEKFVFKIRDLAFDPIPGNLFGVSGQFLVQPAQFELRWFWRGSPVKADSGVFSFVTHK